MQTKDRFQEGFERCLTVVEFLAMGDKAGAFNDQMKRGREVSVPGLNHGHRGKAVESGIDLNRVELPGIKS